MPKKQIWLNFQKIIEPFQGSKRHRILDPGSATLAATYQVHDEEMSEHDARAEHAGQQHV
jgi:hypothetical protein